MGGLRDGRTIDRRRPNVNIGRPAATLVYARVMSDTSTFRCARLVVLGFGLLAGAWVRPAHASECRVYRGDSTSYASLVATVRGDRVYRGDSSSYSELLATGRGNRVYRRDSSSYSELLATVSGDRVYRGDSTSYASLIATIRGDRIYRGDSSSYSQLLATGPQCMLAELAGVAALF